MFGVSSPPFETASKERLSLLRLPNIQRIAAVLLILVQHYTLELLIAPNSVPIVFLALLGAFAPLLRCTVRMHPIFGLVPIAFYYVYQARNTHHHFEEMGFIDSEVAYEMACGFILMQVFLLFLKQFEHRLPIGLLLLASAGMVFAGDIRVSMALRDQMLFVNAAYLAVWVLFAAGSRVGVQRKKSRRVGSTRSLVLVVLTLGTVLLSHALSKWLYLNESHLEQFVGRLVFSGQPVEARRGFSGTGGLNDVSSMRFDQGRDLTLSIQSEKMPGYLRGATFDYFINSRWFETGDAKNVIAIGALDQNLSSEFKKFILQAAVDEENLERMEIFSLDQKATPHFFTTVNTAAFWTPDHMLKVHDSLVLERYSDEHSSSYALSIGPIVGVSPREVHPKYLQIPTGLSPIVEDLAKALYDPSLTPSLQMKKVSEFFNREFEYGLEYEVMRGADRLEYFLIKRLPMHCEFFATATALILRYQGIPARYVTGYVVTENHQGSTHWVARRRDAHAWVEAFDRENGVWQIVESTPGDGVPESESETYLMSLYDAIVVGYRKFAEQIAQASFWEAVFTWIGKLVLWLFLLGLVTLGFRLAWNYRRKQQQVPREYFQMIRERSRFDRFLSRFGLIRTPSESVSHFADRVELSNLLTHTDQIANWYRRYGELRFGGQHVSPDLELEMLRSERVQITREVRRKS